MGREQVLYENHFQVGQQVTVAFRLQNNSFLENNAVVTSIKDNILCLEMIGTGLPADSSINENDNVQITSWCGWALSRCSATFVSSANAKLVCVKLTGPISEQQRREYFRFDVEIPVDWSVSQEQRLEGVEKNWESARECYAAALPPLMQVYKDGFRVVKWEGGEEILPQGINLSGGGARLKMPFQAEPGTMVILNLFLPLLPPRVIHVVAEVLRCNEITLRWEKGSQFIAAMRYHCISGKDRETIISYLFSEQRRALQLSQDRIIA